jgi:hypothetical protein
VGTESDLRLAIRTIAVSTRAAIDSSNKVGRPDAAAECAQRGLTLLDGLRDQLGADVPDEITQLFETAARDLASAARASSADASGSRSRNDGTI